jgi:glycosyltransferase involved in cell wall biosynthesis
LVYGGGPDRERLEHRVQNEGITNVVFKDKWILPKYVPYVLSKADVNLLNYASGWGHYGGSMNKMILAFASGKPLLCNAGLRYSDIRDANLGVDKSFADGKEYAETILSFYNMSKEDYESMCKRVKDISKLYDNQYLCRSFAQYCEIQ